MKSVFSLTVALIALVAVSLFAPRPADACRLARRSAAGGACAACSVPACAPAIATAIPAMPAPPAACTAACAPAAAPVACLPNGPAAGSPGRTQPLRALFAGGKRVLHAVGKVLVAPVKLLKRPS